MATVSLDPSIRRCGFCNTPQTEDGTLKKCGRCRNAFYCGDKCQRSHWPGHKKVCQVKRPKGVDERVKGIVLNKAVDLSTSEARSAAFGAVKKEARGKVGVEGNEKRMQSYLDNEMYTDIIALIFSESDTDLSIKWLNEHKDGHTILMLQYAEMIHDKALMDHPDGNFPKETLIKIVSSYIIALCQKRLDVNCFKGHLQMFGINSCKGYIGVEKIKLLLGRNLYHAEVQECIFHYFDSIDFSKLPSYNYLLGKTELSKLEKKNLCCSTRECRVKRSEMMDRFKEDFISLGLVSTFIKYFVS